MTPPRQHGSYGTRANPRGCLQTAITSVFAIATVLQRTVAQSITIKSAACNFSPFAGNPMTELVAIRVAGSAYFMVGSQNGGTTSSLLLDADCQIVSKVSLAVGMLLGARSEGLKDFEFQQALVAIRTPGTSPNYQLSSLSRSGAGISIRTQTLALKSTPVTDDQGNQFKMILIPSTDLAMGIFRTTNSPTILEFTDLSTGSATQYATSVPTNAVYAELSSAKDGSFVGLFYYTTSVNFIIYEISTRSSIATFRVSNSDATATVARGLLDSFAPIRVYFTAKNDLMVASWSQNKASTDTQALPINKFAKVLGSVVEVGANFEYLLVTELNGPEMWVISKQVTTPPVPISVLSKANIFSTISLGYEVGKDTLIHRIMTMSSPGTSLSSDFSIQKYTFETPRVKCTGVLCPKLILETNSWDAVNRVFTVKFNAKLQQPDLRPILYLAAVKGKPNFPSIPKIEDLKELPAVFFDVVYTEDGRGITGRMKLPTREKDVYMLLLSADRLTPTTVVFSTGFEVFTNMPIVVRVGDYIPRPDPKPPLNGLQIAVIVIYRVIIWAGILIWPFVAAYRSLGRLSVENILKDTQEEQKKRSSFQFSTLVKSIDTLAYTFLVNKTVLSTADSFLWTFRVSPFDIGFNIFTATEPMVVCDPPQPISAGGVSCSTLQNSGPQFTTFVILSGLYLATFLLTYWMKNSQQTTETESKLRRTGLVLLWGMQQIFTSNLLVRVFDALQVESWRYSFIIFNNFKRSDEGLTGALVFAIFLTIAYSVYTVRFLVFGYLKRYGIQQDADTQQTKVEVEAVELATKLSWMDGLFDDFLGPDEIPHKVLYYMPLWQYLRVVSVQALLVFLSGLGFDQLKIIAYIELIFFIMSITANPWASEWNRWIERIHASSLFGIYLFLLLHEYTAENSSERTKTAFSVLVSILVVIFFVNRLIHPFKDLYDHWQKNDSAEMVNLNPITAIEVQTNKPREMVPIEDEVPDPTVPVDNNPEIRNSVFTKPALMASKQHRAGILSPSLPVYTQASVPLHGEVAEENPYRTEQVFTRMQMVNANHLSSQP